MVVGAAVVEDGGAVVEGAGGSVGVGGTVEVTTAVAVGAVLVETGGSLEFVLGASDVSVVLDDATSAAGPPESFWLLPMNGPIRTAPSTTTVATLPHSGQRRHASKPLRIEFILVPPQMSGFAAGVFDDIDRYRPSSASGCWADRDASGAYRRKGWLPIVLVATRKERLLRPRRAMPWAPTWGKWGSVSGASRSRSHFNGTPRQVILLRLPRCRIECQGWVALTGAGGYHTEEISGGMLRGRSR